MNLFFALSAAMALVTFGIHTFVGTRFAVPPLIAAGDVPKATIWLNYLCWHIVTGVTLNLGICLAAVAAGALHKDAVVPCALSFAWIAIWSVITTLKARIPVYRFPASYLGAVTATLAFIGFIQ